MTNRDTSQPIFDRTLKVLVDGMGSNFRYLSKKETPAIARGKGARIWDADENEFIEYLLGLGPIILGYADVRFNRAVVEHLEQVHSASTTP